MDPRPQQDQTPQQTPNGPDVPQPPQPPQNMDAFGVQPPVETPQTAQPNMPAQPQKSRKFLALTLLIGPTVLFLSSILLGFVSTLLNNPNGDAAYGDVSALQLLTSIVTFVLGIVGFIAWLPGLIIGIILLVRKK